MQTSGISSTAFSSFPYVADMTKFQPCPSQAWRLSLGDASKKLTSQVQLKHNAMLSGGLSLHQLTRLSHKAELLFT